MPATPRISNGAFPQTPAHKGAPPTPSPTPSARQSLSAPRRSLPPAPQKTVAKTAAEPRIPLRAIDAPTQRLFALGIYGAVQAWKLYDWSQMLDDDSAQSLWLSLKWIAIDGVYILGLPELRIPWLELSQPVAIFLLVAHAIFTLLIMNHIPVPLLSVLFVYVKAFYFDSELSISDNYVKTSQILHNSSLIQGRQIINILPEGFAVLNPAGTPFCIGGDITTALIPIHFNSTIPREVELIRTDLDTDSSTQEVIKLSRSDIRTIQSHAKKLTPDGTPSAFTFEYRVKKAGAYKLKRVIDEHKLEVQRKSPHTFVVRCPSASIGPSPPSERCLKDLSDLVLNVDGTPPLKIVYSRRINGNKEHSFHFPNLQPDGFSSPLIGVASSSLTLLEDEDISWARSQRVPVSLNESLYSGGEWQYSVDEVHDGLGNVVRYASPTDDPEYRPKAAKTLVKTFSVRERPKVHLTKCDIRNPLKVARGQRVSLPVVFETTGQKADERPHALTWDFSPIDTLTRNGDPGDVVIPGSHVSKKPGDAPVVSAPGLYTLKTVSAGSCEGEVQEPASCLVLNPLEPELSVRSRDIPDKCAGNSVGLIVNLDLVGTPPFVVHYNEVFSGRVEHKVVRISGTRHEMELTPQEEGTHKYTFTSVDDALYKQVPLTGSGYTLEQDVKPAAFAEISRRYDNKPLSACLEQQVDIDVVFSGGEPHYTLEYEIAHEGKRTPYKVAGIQSREQTLRTPALSKGGEYTLALTSVMDKRGCKNSLQNEMKINVRRQRPRASFGVIEGRRKALNIESPDAKHKLPVRLTGVGPWKVTYKNFDQPGSPLIHQTVQNSNGVVTARDPGTYELVEVSDSQCPGAVDPKASTFEVSWLPRPELSLVQSDSVSQAGDLFVKKDVCEGDIDGFEISLKGSPPYHVKYQIHHKPTSGPASSTRKEFDAALSKSAISMLTAKPGLYTYTFTDLADSLYDLSKKQFTPVVLQQRVNAKPTATFDKPGQVFKFCMSEQDYEEKIPVTLTGVAPFFLELEIKHHSNGVPQVHRIPSVNSNKFGVQLPRELLRLGPQQVRIREVRDARGCQFRSEIGGSSVQVQLYDAPAIYPLETRTDYCVGERLAYTLSGTPPFQVSYTFGGQKRSANSPTTSFRRIADSPGEFSITSVSDKASECRAAVELVKRIHPMPSVRISRGQNVQVDIHEGGEVEILFEFGGTPPFEFTYTRSTNARKGQKSKVLETRHDVSFEHSKVVRASQEGTYQVVAIKDKYCAFSTQQVDVKDGSQKLLQ
ncbi:hypothetical protein MCOR27_004037 [Pyricularia oryzae]|nr:hypothetical protein MCOR27_004037 [Pyricularia oryzae]